eukprot:6182651-Pleurochrysis_carterae.AAC.1
MEALKAKATDRLACIDDACSKSYHILSNASSPCYHPPLLLPQWPFLAPSSTPPYSSGRTATILAPSHASRAASARGHASCHHSWSQSVDIAGSQRDSSEAIMRLHPSLNAEMASSL